MSSVEKKQLPCAKVTASKALKENTNIAPGPTSEVPQVTWNIKSQCLFAKNDHWYCVSKRWISVTVKWRGLEVFMLTSFIGRQWPNI